MAEFLSDEWIAELDGAARGSASLAEVGVRAPVVIEQRVRRGSDEIVYALCLGPDGARVDRGPAPAPDVVITTDAGTARSLQLGTVNVQQAAVAGRLKIHGHVQQLRSTGEALRSVDDVFSEVRASTTVADPADSDATRHR